MVAQRQTPKSSKAVRPPATTPDGRESQMVAAAFDLAERQILEGTASAQVITHFLKLGGRREVLEREALMKDNALKQARIDQLESSKDIQELYGKAIGAMRAYQGQEVEYDEDD